MQNVAEGLEGMNLRSSSSSPTDSVEATARSAASGGEEAAAAARGASAGGEAVYAKVSGSFFCGFSLELSSMILK